MDKKEDTGISLIKKLSFEATGEELNDTEAKAINLDSIVHEFIEKLWNEYDTNKSGVLEEKQAKKLMMDIVLECMGEDAEEVTIGEEELDELFNECDHEKNGQISKTEFRTLLKEATGM